MPALVPHQNLDSRERPKRVDCAPSVSMSQGARFVGIRTHSEKLFKSQSWLEAIRSRYERVCAMRQVHLDFGKL